MCWERGEERERERGASRGARCRGVDIRVSELHCCCYFYEYHCRSCRRNGEWLLWAPAALCLRAKQSACTDDGDAVRITTKQGREERFFARYSGNANTRNPTRSLSETSAPPHEHNPRLTPEDTTLFRLTTFSLLTTPSTRTPVPSVLWLASSLFLPHVVAVEKIAGHHVHTLHGRHAPRVAVLVGPHRRAGGERRRKSPGARQCLGRRGSSRRRVQEDQRRKAESGGGDEASRATRERRGKRALRKRKKHSAKRSVSENGFVQPDDFSPRFRLVK